jgi:hypothetical protein
MNFDDSQLLFGKDFEIDDKIKIHHPTLKEIFDFGEQKYMQIVSLLTSTPADFKSQLFDMGIDYETINEFEFFMTISDDLQVCDTNLIFGDIDISKFKAALNKEINEKVLIDMDSGAVIDRLVYLKTTEFLRKIMNFKKNTERAANPLTKQVMIELHKKDMEANSKKPYKSTLCTLISAMVNSKEFKYDYTTVLNLPVYTFMDAVQRIQKIKGYEGLVTGMYSGNIDISKIQGKDKILNWMGEI